MHNIQIEIMCKWALRTVNQFFFFVYTSNSLYKRPVLEPDVLTQIASIQKIHSNLHRSPKRKKKKSQVFKLIYIELERDYAEMVFKQISSPSRKVSHLLVLMVGVGE